MSAAFRAELLKLRKRPGVLILIVTMFTTVVLFGYVALYVVATQASPEQLAGLDPNELLDTLRPAALPVQVLGILAGPGVAIALILGALAIGAEHNWRTLKTITTQQPQRLPLMSGHMLAVLAASVALVVTGFVGGVAGTGLVAVLAPVDSPLPGVGETSAALGAGVLAFAVWCAVGMCLATLFRGTAWAVGIGLLYALVVESVLELLPLAGGLGDVVARSLIGNNIAALAANAVPEAAMTLGPPVVPISTTQAIAVLLAYLLGSLAIATAVFLSRDIAD